MDIEITDHDSNYRYRSLHARYEAALVALAQEQLTANELAKDRDNWKRAHLKTVTKLINTETAHAALSKEHDLMCQEVNLLRERYHALKQDYDRLLTTVKELQ